MWKGRIDSERKERFHQFVKCVNIDSIQKNHQSNHIAFVGFASDEGVIRNKGRPGAKEGPSAIRNALSSLAFHRPDINLYDIGDITCNDHNLERSQMKLADTISQLLKRKIHPIVLGGGHEVAWGHFQGITQIYPSDSLGIINFDAHLDMRPLQEKGSSGTPFMQMAMYSQQCGVPLHYTCIGAQPSGNTNTLLESAAQFDVRIIRAEDIHLKSDESPLEKLKKWVEKIPFLYVTICMDVFGSAYSPGVSAPQPLGISPWQLIPFLRFLAASGKVISLDIAELSPPLDYNGMTARLAGSLIADYIQHLKISLCN